LTLELPNPGDLVDGKYRIVRPIGKGGMGAVYVAYHELLRHEVALKMLLPEVAKNQEAVSRFVREARAVARLKNAHVATVMDIGTLASGSAYMAMEYLEGQDLETMLGERGPLPVAEATDYVLQALEGIAHAHALGIIHRDLKPANLFVMRRYDGAPVVKVLDFGIAKATRTVPIGASVSTSTSGNKLLGSPLYMSPEQVRSSKAADVRVDIWAIGVTFYRLLTNRSAFDGESIGALFAAILEDTPPPPSAHRPDVPPELDRAILRCLERKPDARWQSAGELARAIAPHAPGAEVAVDRIERTLADTDPERSIRPAESQKPAASRDARGPLAKRTITVRPEIEAPPQLPAAALAPNGPPGRARPWALAAVVAVVLAGIAAAVVLATR
jgi:serine/threonine-protein kinase